MGGTAARVGAREGGAGRRAERPEHVAFAAPAIVDLLPGTPRSGWAGSDEAPARIALGAETAHLV